MVFILLRHGFYTIMSLFLYFYIIAFYTFMNVFLILLFVCVYCGKSTLSQQKAYSSIYCLSTIENIYL